MKFILIFGTIYFIIINKNCRDNKLCDEGFEKISLEMKELENLTCIELNLL